MATNVYFSQGTRNEQYLVEDLIIESLKIYGQEVLYIPRVLFSKDDILGEDRLSQFRNAFPIEMYFENIDSFDGQGAFLQKFGLMMEQSATLVVARRRWTQLVGRYGVTTIPNRPNEGDLIYFPLTKGLFEIKFVKHQDPFYQLGRLYVYKLQVELFQYSSERIDTGIAEIDTFETLKTFSTNTTRNRTGRVTSINITNPGVGYIAENTTINIRSNTGRGAVVVPTVVNGFVVGATISDGGSGYTDDTTCTISGAGNNASATVVVEIDVDQADSYGDNNKFKREAKNFMFNEANPFGELVDTPESTISFVAHNTADSTTLTSDSTTITADKQ